MDNDMNIEVKMGEISVAHAGDILTASGVGSCLIITLWDPKLKIGALAHAMLSARNPESNQGNKIYPNQRISEKDTRYVHFAIDEMLKKIDPLHIKREVIEAKLIGGANMFAALNSDFGLENVHSAQSKLKEESISIIGECVGGSQGRSVEFSVASGVVTVKTKF